MYKLSPPEEDIIENLPGAHAAAIPTGTITNAIPAKTAPNLGTSDNSRGTRNHNQTHPARKTKKNSGRVIMPKALLSPRKNQCQPLSFSFTSRKSDTITTAQNAAH